MKLQFESLAVLIKWIPLSFLVGLIVGIAVNVFVLLLNSSVSFLSGFNYFLLLPLRRKIISGVMAQTLSSGKLLIGRNHFLL
ncbi:TPA: hypothetical protein HA244_04030 [Candidatus Micrarchaeota archaeon]|nr:hypothetical protein [Candidatus Micrarchaeota archaeon]